MARPSRRPPPRRTTTTPVHLDVTIDSLGGLGDGVGRQGEQAVFVPLTVPGDRCTVRVTGKRGDGQVAQLVHVLTPGPDRVSPPCPVYGSCGGCTLQHLDAAAYRAWKEDSFAQTLDKAGVDLDGGVLAPLVAIAPGTRRRAALAFVKPATRWF